jgi:U3 small nucleolar RNA-associated protein MPP10
MFSLALEAENASRPHITELLSSLSPSAAIQTRSQAAKKRKRDSSPSPPPPVFEPTPISSLFTEGMDDEQIWAQLDLRMKPVCDMLELALDAELPQEEDHDDNDTDEFVDEQLLRQLRALESGDGLDGMELDDLEDVEDDDSEEELDAESEEESADDVDLGEGVTGLRDPSSDEDSEPEADNWPSALGKRRGEKKRTAGSKTGLDDGFFDLASFNAETEEAEARKVSRGRLDDDDDDSDDESVDLFAPVDVAENFDEEDEDNAGGARTSFLNLNNFSITLQKHFTKISLSHLVTPPRCDRQNLPHL